MPKSNLSEQLDRAIQALLAPGPAPRRRDGAAPKAQQTATAYLIVNGAARALEFYKQAFGAVETMRLNGPGDRIGHAEIRIGNSTIMLADEFPDYGALSAQP